MISLILPYWNRKKAALAALAVLEQHYAGRIEVVIVDDGNPEPFVPPKSALDIKVVRLPTKTGPKCPATAWNAGVAAARGDVIVLSCIEILHDRGPILDGMLDELESQGPNAYVLAAAWCPEHNAWHTHSSVSVPQCPKGSGIAFCAMLKKELFNRAGGFGEEYREGAGYEDRDFIWRLTVAGAKFIHRDDLVVTHPKSGATIHWGDDKFAINQKLFEDRWVNVRRVTFACVQAGNYCGRGSEYVNNLYDMVLRNLPAGMVFRFVCLTDDPKGLHERIEVLPLPSDLEGWYGKLYLFKRGLFEDGERLVFMDLDTIIVGKLDDLVAYDGQFATLEDFYFPERLGPAVIAWRAGAFASSIWEEWEAAGKPRNPLGDLGWINDLDQGRFPKTVDRLQALFPKDFCSYKKSCAPRPPKGTKVVCFHGKPRPHEAVETDDWVAMAWKVGGLTQNELETVPNTAYEVTSANVRAACARPLEWLPLATKPLEGALAVVGGGPSLVEKLDELRESAKNGMRIFAVNGAHDFLRANGIEPDAHVIIDARIENERFITKPAKHYYLASQCHPALFEKAKAPTTLVHMNTRGILESIPDTIKPINLISSGCTVGLAALAIGYCLGERKFYLYGMDSSIEERHHAYEQSMNDADKTIEAVAGGRTFKCAPWMLAQVEHFQKLAAELAQADCEIHVRCGGLLGHVAWLWTNQKAAA